MCASNVDPTEEAEYTPIQIGKISKVFPKYGFVLIQHERHIPIPDKGTILLSQSKTGSRRANLAVSGERLSSARDFPADINSGEVQVGDFVFIYESLSDSNKVVSKLTPQEEPLFPEKKDLPIEPSEELPQKKDITPDENLPSDFDSPIKPPSKEELDKERIDDLGLGLPK